MKISSSLLAASAALSLHFVVAPAYAQGKDPKIKALLSSVASAYRNLKSFSATVSMTQGTRLSTSVIVLKRPTFISASVAVGAEIKRVVSDGVNLYADTSRDKTKYFKLPVKNIDDVINGLAKSGGTGVGLLPVLLTSKAAENEIVPGEPNTIKLLRDAAVGAITCDVLEATLGEAPRVSAYTFYFGKADHLLRKLTIAPATVGTAPSMVELHSNIKTTPITTITTFKYVPRAGAIASVPPKAPAMFDERLKVGANPLPISGKSLTGDDITLESYKGKVLLLDFWATWCGPCVAELPNVLEAYTKFHEKGFEILGISLDQESARPALEQFIKDRKMPWTQIYDGKYWQAANAVAYGVHSIPFTLLIGKDGKIVAVGARGPDLAPAIEAALKK